ncbi:MAG: HPF/RaiA family ribosome-associated protein [Melioribacteraceae bacterium]|nr:HPF/RaiA family ribosome-associated protein [Melioribacteraceae bacterium]
MKIQFNTSNNIKESKYLRTLSTSTITDELSRFSDNITRVEIHLSDEDGHKSGQNDKRCSLEARIVGRQPIAVTNYADTHQQAINGAIEKMKSSLNTIFGRRDNNY